MAKNFISIERLKETLSYDPETGVFTYSIDRPPHMKGSVAGSKNINGYINIRIDGKDHKAHRLAFLWMTGKYPEFSDHINHLRHDNRWLNLRDFTRSQNNRSALRRKDNKTGNTGVFHKPDYGYWVSHIRVNRKRITLYHGKNQWKAIWCRKMAEIIHGFDKSHGSLLSNDAF